MVIWCRIPILLLTFLRIPSASVLGLVRSAREGLFQAFAEGHGQEDLNLALNKLRDLKEVAAFTQEVQGGGWARTLLDGSGNIKYVLTDDDMEAVQAFLDEHVFVIIDVLNLVSLSPEALPEFLEADMKHSLCHRIVAELQAPWWSVLTSTTSWAWSVPFFGALALLARQVRAPHYSPNAYRDLLWASNIQTPDRGEHLSILGEPWATFEYHRGEAYRRACAWLSIAEGQLAIEEAERQYKAFLDSSLSVVLETAAEWPIFDILHRLALKSDQLHATPEKPESLPDASIVSATGDPVEEPSQIQLAAGRQRLPQEEVLELYRMLHLVGKVCDALHITWWVSHGTLLGALRDGGLSRHADDCEIDIWGGVHVEMLQNHAMRAILSRNGYELSYDPRGKTFKVWPAGSKQAATKEDQLRDQTWWLPQRRVGSPSLDIYVVDHVERDSTYHYVSNDEFHCNHKVCTQIWKASELDGFRETEFGLSTVWVPAGAESYLDRVYGADWRSTVRPHRWASKNLGLDFEAQDVSSLHRKTAEPFGPLLDPVIPPRFQQGMTSRM